ELMTTFVPILIPLPPVAVVVMVVGAPVRFRVLIPVLADCCWKMICPLPLGRNLMAPPDPLLTPADCAVDADARFTTRSLLPPEESKVICELPVADICAPFPRKILGELT